MAVSEKNTDKDRLKGENYTDCIKIQTYMGAFTRVKDPMK